MITLSTEMILTLQQLKRIGNKTILKLTQQIQTPISSLDQLYRFWKTLKGKDFESKTKEDLDDANRIAKRIIFQCEQEGIGIISFFEDSYPEILKSCKDEEGKLDPPLILYYRGNIKVLMKHGIAIIGTREPTANGVLAGKHFSSEFAKRGYNIVSGLAIGCDTTGHQGALAVGGATTAFLANGLDWASIYPKENLNLAKDIVTKGGLLLSEYPIGQTCGKYSLVARDRLQAGLSYATIVIQTGERGGTMHAVNATINSKKPLFAVEYKTYEDTKHDKVQGNIELIKDGKAHPLRSTAIDEAIRFIENAYKVPKREVKQTTLQLDL
ncbi:DNA-processing protein DprA [Bacteroides sp. AM18-9]|jgi:DNA processing protein|nr:DNA-processing protein DprA [Bacteroides sp. AM18-9]